MRGDGSVANEERVVGLPKFHSWSKCTMPLNQLRLDVYVHTPRANILKWALSSVAQGY